MTDQLKEALIGRRIISTDGPRNTCTLDNGSVLSFEEYGDCCAIGWVERLASFDNVITDVRYSGDGDDPNGEGISIYVLSEVSMDTEIAHIMGDEGSGYYSYGVRILLNGVEIDNIAQP